MSNGFSIDALRGTPLYALAQNANVNGGGTLDAAEMFAFQQQMQNMGWSPEQFGLAVETTDNAGETANETRKNMQKAGKDLEKNYKAQFGKQGSEAAQTAEQRADAVVKTAYDMFKYEHGNTMFVPQSLGARPKYTNAQYMDDVARYSADLMQWANDVKQEYINATKMTNEQLAALIVSNDNNNARDIMINDSTNAAQLSNQMDEGFDKVNANIDASTNRVIANDNKNTNRVIANDNKNTASIHNHITADGDLTRYQNAVNTAGLHQHISADGNYTRGVVRAENDYTRHTVRKTAEDIKDTVTEDGDKTRAKIDAESEKVQKLIKEKGAEVIDTLDPLYVKRAVKGVRDMAIAAGKSVAEFIADNPGLLVGGIPVGILAARGLLNN